MIESSFVDAARGGSSIDFTRKVKKDTKVVNTLLTGLIHSRGRQVRTARAMEPFRARVLDWMEKA